MSDSVQSVPPQLKPWRKGQSGNPRGVSRDQHALASRIRKAAAELTPEALEFLRDAWRNPKVRWADRIAAAKGVLACGHADAAKNDAAPSDLTLIVRTLEVQGKPTPGVLSHPDPTWVALPSPASASRK